MLGRQQPCIPIVFAKKRKSLTYHIVRHHPKRTTNADFNSQIFSHQNSPDFTNIVTSFTHLPNKEPTPHPPPPSHTGHPHEGRNEEKGDSPPPYPLRISKYPSIKLDLPKQPSKRTLRRLTEPAYSLSPTRFKLLCQPRERQLGESEAVFKRYQSHHSPSMERKQLQLTRMLPQLPHRLPPDKLAETAIASSSVEIIKPWETRRDIFHQTFKRYIAEHRKQTQWTHPALQTHNDQ